MLQRVQRVDTTVRIGQQGVTMVLAERKLCLRAILLL